MPVTGSIDHIDISVGYPERSIPFYEALLTALGFKRIEADIAGITGPNPTRAWWALRYSDGAVFGIEVRPAYEDRRDRRYDRYEPGPHHTAFHAESPERVNAVHRAMVAVGAEVLDPPRDYSGERGYSEGYYAVFFADPDHVKLEVVYNPATNP